MKEKFCLTIDYDRGSPDPEHVFYGVGKLLESMKHIDANLSSCIGSNITPVLLLEDIETGSIRLWLKSVFEDMPDEALESTDIKKFAGHYLVKAKYAMIRFLENRDSIEDAKEIEALESELVGIARETGAQSLDIYHAPVRSSLLESLSEVGEALSCFREKENVFIETTEDSQIAINKHFRLPRNDIEKLCQGETITNFSTVVLKLKQPDFLGDSQWVFRHGEHTLKAKMEDAAWMQAYRERRFAVYPGDSLRVSLRTTETYSNAHELIDEKHFIVSVEEIVPAVKDEQLRMDL